MVRIQFSAPGPDGNPVIIEEDDAVNFGYAVGKYGDMTIATVSDNENTLLSVHTGVRSAWNVPALTTAFDISSLPKKGK